MPGTGFLGSGFISYLLFTLLFLWSDSYLFILYGYLFHGYWLSILPNPLFFPLISIYLLKGPLLRVACTSPIFFFQQK